MVVNIKYAPISGTTPHLKYYLPAQLRRCVPLSFFILIIFLFTVSLSGYQASYPALIWPSLHAKSAVSTEFPRKIWQTWKVNAFNFAQRERDRARSWTEKNPDYEYEVLTDENVLSYVERHFGCDGLNRPDIVDFYRELKASIVKSDLLRYMVMYVEGGVYADIDVEALKPMGRFIPDMFDAKDFDLVIGLEVDEPSWKNHPILGARSRSFCQWTFMSKPRLAVMLRLIEHVKTWLEGVAKKQGVGIGDVQLDFNDIVTGTGPLAFTEAILADMNKHRYRRQLYTWDDFHNLSAPMLAGRTLVLTIDAFAAGQSHSNSGSHDSESAMVRHHFGASNWPHQHKMYEHPVYGAVEACEWNAECIHKWDANVDAFEMEHKDKEKIIDGR